MRLLRVLASAALAGVVAADAVKDLQDQGRPALDAVIEESTTCSKDDLQVRREWYVRLTIHCLARVDRLNRIGCFLG